MKKDGISRIKWVDVHADTILSKQSLFSLHLWLGDNKQATRQLSKRAVLHLSQVGALC